VGGFLDDGGSLIDIEQRQVRATGHIEQDAASAVNGDVQQLAGDGHLGRNPGFVFTAGMTHSHQGRAAFGHDRLDIGKIQVDQTGDGDQFGNALDALAQHIISNAEGILQAGALVHNLQQSIVGDNNQRVRMFLQPVDAILGR